MDKAVTPLFLGIQPTSIFRDLSVEGSRKMNCRGSHGFIMKLQGSTEYRSEEGSWLLEAGQILFVKKGSSYSIREVAQGYSCVVNFDSGQNYPRNLTMLTLPKNFDLTAAAGRLYYVWQKDRKYAASAELYEILDKTDRAEHIYVSSNERQLLQTVSDYLRDHLTDPELKPEYLTSLTGISDTYFRKLFKKQFGKPPTAYIISQRISIAKRLLESGEEATVSAVALRCGYKDPLYFSRLFKNQVGLSPREYAGLHINQRF